MKNEEKDVWQDRKLLFDLSKKELNLTNGEETFESMSMIEDCKGNGELGSFLFTNLRVLWYNNRNPKKNLSIGYDCFEDISEKSEDSKMTGQTKIIIIKCRYENTRYELMFRNISENNQGLYVTLNNILKIYEAGRYYRDVKINTQIVKEKTGVPTKLLDEEMVQKFGNIHLSSENSQDKKSDCGTLFKTNIRLVWVNDKAPAYNISIPWIQIKNIIEDQNEYGLCLKITLKNYFAGSSYLFYAPNGSISKQMIEDLSKSIITYNENRILGIDIKKISKKKDNDNNEEKGKKRDKLKEKFEKIVEKVFSNDKEIEEKDAYSQAEMIYLVNGSKTKTNAINDLVFCKELGLAIEKLPEGISIDNLWRIIKE